MKKHVLLMFVLGCATGAATNNILTKAEANAPAGATRWEYKCVAGLRWSGMNTLGAAGWELASTSAPGGDGSDLCFKRPLVN